MRAALIIPLLLVAGCASRRIGSTDTVRRGLAVGSPDSVFGRSVTVERADTEYNGELLACDWVSIYLLINQESDSPNPYRAVPIEGATVELADDHARIPLAAATVFGTLSTLTHGFILIFSAPIWALSGAGATVFAKAPSLNGCRAMAPYARFPQGLPDEMRVRFFDDQWRFERAPQPSPKTEEEQTPGDAPRTSTTTSTTAG
jgi:hypothetical protein